MLSELFDEDELRNSRKAARLETYHQRRFSPLLWLLLIGLGGFVAWASWFRVDEVTRSQGEVIASSRVQVIQAVDGGVLQALLVREGDRVKAGQVIARLDQSRIGAAVREIEARLSSLQAKAIRLRAEVTGADTLAFPPEVLRFPELATVERALFTQRRTGLEEELKTLTVAVNLARREADLVARLSRSGDVNSAEVIRSRKALNDAQARLVNRRNQFLEEAGKELTRAEDELAQNEQVLAQRRQQLEDSVITAPVAGVIKNIRVTTVGGVLRAGEELMQLLPIDDELLLETKVRPADIARIHPGLEATIRFDPFDYTIYGAVHGKVVYVSADTLKEDTRQGEEIYYRVHIAPQAWPVTTTTGRQLDIIPGMTAQADIRTGDRTLMDFLLKPVRKTLSESFGER